LESKFMVWIVRLHKCLIHISTVVWDCWCVKRCHYNFFLRRNEINKWKLLSNTVNKFDSYFPHLSVTHTKVRSRVWSPGVNFTNILCVAFTCVDPKSAKRLTSWIYIFALLGSARRKAARRTFVKLTHGQLGLKRSQNLPTTGTFFHKTVVIF